MWAQERKAELAAILVATIREFFPNGGLVAFSVGHKYKTSSPNDRGAESVLGGPPEAELAEPVLLLAATLLEKANPTPPAEAEDHRDEPILVAGPSAWAKDAVAWATANGITDGSRLHEPITREEALTLLHRTNTRGH